MKIHSVIKLAIVAAASTLPASAFAQEEVAPGLTVSGGATVVSDYRVRGFSQTNEKAAIQGSISLNHDSGLYLGTWGSSIAFGNGTEIDVFAGYATEVSPGLTVDAGVTAYLYPGASENNFVEPFAAVSGDFGPASVRTAIAWAPGGQKALGGDSGVYLSVDAGVGLPGTPVTLTGHMGFAKSDSFLGGADGDVIDYSIGAETRWKALTLGISYVNTDATKRGGFKESVGADGAILFSLDAAF